MAAFSVSTPSSWKICQSDGSPVEWTKKDQEYSFSKGFLQADPSIDSLPEFCIHFKSFVKKMTLSIFSNSRNIEVYLLCSSSSQFQYFKTVRGEELGALKDYFNTMIEIDSSLKEMKFKFLSIKPTKELQSTSSKTVSILQFRMDFEVQNELEQVDSSPQLPGIPSIPPIPSGSDPILSLLRGLTSNSGSPFPSSSPFPSHPSPFPSSLMTPSSLSSTPPLSSVPSLSPSLSSTSSIPSPPFSHIFSSLQSQLLSSLTSSLSSTLSASLDSALLPIHSKLDRLDERLKRLEEIATTSSSSFISSSSHPVGIISNRKEPKDESIVKEEEKEEEEETREFSSSKQMNPITQEGDEIENETLMRGETEKESSKEREGKREGEGERKMREILVETDEIDDDVSDQRKEDDDRQEDGERKIREEIFNNGIGLVD